MWVVVGRLSEFLLALLLTEVLARWALGLGTPPLWVAHPTMEYLQRPNQDIYRFGRHFLVNQWGMRSLPVTQRKVPGNDEYRVLVLGDSIINGGALTDHQDLATSIAERELNNELHRDIRVLNVSAGSWGPGNFLAYIDEFGLFDADLMVLVLNSGDAADVRNFLPLDPHSYPTQAPTLALEEGLIRYLRPRVADYVSALLPVQATSHSTSTTTGLRAEDIESASRDLRRLIQKGRERGRPVVALMHPTLAELGKDLSDTSALEPGHEILRTLFADEAVPLTDLRPLWLSARDHSASVYRDEIHLNDVGQAALAKVLEGLIRDAIANQGTAAVPVAAPAGAAPSRYSREPSLIRHNHASRDITGGVTGR